MAINNSNFKIKNGVNVGANLVFDGIAARIQGDFSNATFSNRVAFQTSITNGSTSIATLPNGTSNQSSIQAYNNSDPTNASRVQLDITGTSANLRSTLTGTGSALPLAFYTGSAERLRIDTAGQLGIGGANYGTAGQVLTSGGPSAAPSWTTVAAGSLTLSDDATTNSTHYLTLSTVTSGTLSALKVSSSKLSFNPSTGNLGIGVSVSPTTLLGTIENGFGLVTRNSGAIISNNLTYNSAWKYIGNGFGGVIRFDSTAGNISFLTAPNNTGGAAAAATTTAALLIDCATGNVGIGGTPAASSGTLQVIGNYGAPSTAFAGTSVAAIRLNSTGSFSEPRIDFAEGSMSPIGFIAGKNLGNGGGNLMFFTRDTSSASSTLTLRFQTNENGTYTSSFSRAVGLSTAWGTTNGQFTGAFNALMGTSSSATWLLSGSSGGTFRCGIQALDSNGQIRVHSNGSYIDINGGTITGALSGNATSATNASNLFATGSTWGTFGTITACVGQLAWKNYGNGHSIFDASAGTTPTGAACNSTNSAQAWQASFPTLMGWNGSQTYGVRVDSARVADSATTAANYLPLAGGTLTGDLTLPTLYATGLLVGHNQTSSSITMQDTDEGIRTIHCNSNRIGFLTQAGGWGSYCIDDGSWYSEGNITALGQMYTNGWFRSSGAQGWYNESYGGGIYMTDSTYVRTYNNKSFVAHSYVEIANNYGAVSGAQNINVLNGSMVSMTLNGATTYTFSGAPVSGNAASFTLELTNGGAYTVTWPAGTKWSSGSAPTLTASGTDILTFYTRDGGTTWRGVMVSKDSR